MSTPSATMTIQIIPQKNVSANIILLLSYAPGLGNK
jgi:hypothetical protein